MKKRGESLFFRLDEPTEDQLFAEFDEYFFACSRTLINFTVEDAAAVVKVFFAPVIRTMLKRIESQNRTLVASNRGRTDNAQAKYQKYRGIALKLYEQDPALKRAKKEKLAKEVRAVLARRGTSVSTKTIKRALSPKK
jgi:hypothetical protein